MYCNTAKTMVCDVAMLCVKMMVCVVAINCLDIMVILQLANSDVKMV